MEHGSAEGHSNFQVFCLVGSRARAWGAKKEGVRTFRPLRAKKNHPVLPLRVSFLSSLII